MFGRWLGWVGSLVSRAIHWWAQRFAMQLGGGTGLDSWTPLMLAGHLSLGEQMQQSLNVSLKKFICWPVWYGSSHAGWNSKAPCVLLLCGLHAQPMPCLVPASEATPTAPRNHIFHFWLSVSRKIDSYGWNGLCSSWTLWDLLVSWADWEKWGEILHSIHLLH